jgi:hypothetical protein
MFNEIKDHVQLIEAHIQVLKPLFEASITNKEVPLETRWSLWINSPAYLKNTEDWTIHLKSLPRDVCWYSDYNVDRYQTCTLQSLLEDDFDTEEQNFTKDLTTEQIALMEEILELNLYSFVNDW